MRNKVGEKSACEMGRASNERGRNKKLMGEKAEQREKKIVGERRTVERIN